MIRLVHVVPFMRVGGVEQVVLDLCRHRDRSRFSTVVLAPNGSPVADEIQAAGTPVVIDSAAYPRVLADADLVNYHYGGYLSGWHKLIIQSGRPYVVTVHG